MSKQLQDCLEKEQPFCAEACPFHYDIRDFISRLQRGSFSSAFRVFSNSVAFPELVARLCPARCGSVCPRSKTDAAVDLHKLEQAALALAGNTKPNCYNMPAKSARFAIIGAGPSGMACALRLCNKKYQVHVYERTADVGGSLTALLPSGQAQAAIKREFQFEKYEFFPRREITDLDDLLSVYDGVYIATGRGGWDFGLLEPELSTVGPVASRRPGVYLGGGMVGGDAMDAIAQGINAAKLLDAYLQTGKMAQAPVQRETRIQLDPQAIQYQEPVRVAGGYDREQARAEAARCISCRCDSCQRHCPMMKYFGKFPQRIAEEVQVTIQPGTLDGNGTVATRLISSCSQCGLCKEVCPQDIDMGAYMNWSHRQMSPKPTWPWVFHEFFLRDMEQANSQGGLVASPVKSPRRLFFPGCQLGAADPRYVTSAYRQLLVWEPSTAIYLGCCGAPAVWAADLTVQEEVMDRIRRQWEDYDRPLMIAACPSCRLLLGRYLPEIKTELLSDLLVEEGLRPTRMQRGDYAVFDPCALRNDELSRKNIRSLAQSAGYLLSELEYSGTKAQCCSYGGQIARTNPTYYKWLKDQRAAASELPYLTACINCYRSFISQNKDCDYILNLLPGAEEARPAMDLNQAQRNRVETRRAVVREFFPGLQSNEVDCSNLPVLDIPTQLRSKLDRDYITESDVRRTLARCEESGRKIKDSRSGHLFGSSQIGHATYWVEYAAGPAGVYTVYNAYCHRMTAEEV